MEILKLTKKDFKETNYYWKEYVGKKDVSDFQGHIDIEGSLGWVKFNSIKATGHIWAEAGTGIEAGWGIKSGTGIKAGWGIEAGEGIEAGWGIKSGLSITCKLSISWAYKLFAGICYWKNCSDEEKTITCGKLEPKNGATVEYGIVKEIGIKEKSLSGQEVKVTIGDKTYTAIIK